MFFPNIISEWSLKKKANIALWAPVPNCYSSKFELLNGKQYGTSGTPGKNTNPEDFVVTISFNELLLSLCVILLLRYGRLADGA